MTDQTYNVILPDKGVPVEAWTLIWWRSCIPCARWCAWRG